MADPTLVAQYKFNGDELDAVGSRNLGITDVTFTTGITGQAIAGDGNNGSSASYSGSAIVASGSAFTVSFWIKVTTRDTDSHYLSFSASGNLRWKNVFGVGVEVDIGNAALTSAEITDTNWHHVVMTFGSGTAKLYTDGVLSDSDASTGVTMGDEISIFIFNNGNGVSLIDNLMLFSGAADATYVGLLYNAGAGTETAPSTGGGAGARFAGSLFLLGVGN